MPRIMRSFFFLLMVLGTGSIFFSACGSGGDPLFEMPIEAQFDIPAGLDNFQTHYFIIRRVPTFAQRYGISERDGVERINAGRGLLAAQFNAVDWGSVREISIHISGSNDLENGKEVFFQDRIDFSGVEELRLFSSLSEVKDILLQDFVDIEVRLNFRRITIQEIDARLNLNFVAYGPE